MTSCLILLLRDEDRARDARTCRVVLRLALALSIIAGIGCTPPPTEDHAILQRPMNAANECNGPDGLQVPDSVTMDTYIVQTWDVAPSFAPARSTSTNSNDCETCIGTGACTIEHPRVCTCSGSVTAIPENLGEALATTRIPALDTNDVYCFRVIAVDNGTVGTFPPAPCACSLAWEDPMFLGNPMSRARLCAVSSPAAVGPLEIRMDLRCPGDGLGGRGGNNNLPFNNCLVQPM
jgi:hypothetical protein